MADGRWCITVLNVRLHLFPWSPMSSSVSSVVGGGSRISRGVCNNTVRSNIQDMWVNLIHSREVIFKPLQAGIDSGGFSLRVYSQSTSAVQSILRSTVQSILKSTVQSIWVRGTADFIYMYSWFFRIWYSWFYNLLQSIWVFTTVDSLDDYSWFCLHRLLYSWFWTLVPLIQILIQLISCWFVPLIFTYIIQLIS